MYHPVPRLWIEQECDRLVSHAVPTPCWTLCNGLYTHWINSCVFSEESGLSSSCSSTISSEKLQVRCQAIHGQWKAQRLEALGFRGSSSPSEDFLLAFIYIRRGLSVTGAFGQAHAGCYRLAAQFGSRLQFFRHFDAGIECLFPKE